MPGTASTKHEVAALSFHTFLHVRGRTFKRCKRARESLPVAPVPCSPVLWPRGTSVPNLQPPPPPDGWEAQHGQGGAAGHPVSGWLTASCPLAVAGGENASDVFLKPVRYVKTRNVPVCWVHELHALGKQDGEGVGLGPAPGWLQDVHSAPPPSSCVTLAKSKPSQSLSLFTHKTAPLTSIT